MRHRSFPTHLVLALLMAMAAAGAWAKNPHGKHGGKQESYAATFTDPEVEAFRGYYVSPSGKEKSLPPGLQKKLARGGSLPPGWQKKLAVGQVMSREVYRYAEPVPVAVLQRLPPQPPNSVVVRVDRQVVRVDRPSLRVTAVFDLY